MVNIKMDSASVKKGMANLSRGLANPKEPLQETNKWLLNDIETNFEKEGALYEKWAPLKSVTIAERVAKGYGEGPILFRTGKLLDGIKSKVVGNVAEIYNNVSYFKIHQQGGINKQGYKVPQRLILDISDKGIKAITDIFTKWIIEIIGR